MKEIKIDENLAKRSKENMSFDSYQKNSATEEYNLQIEEVKKKIETAKDKVSDKGKEKLDKLFSQYKYKLANWTNEHNKNGSSHVSVMIAGPAKYNMKKHEKYLSRERKLWEEYDKLKNIEQKICSIVNGNKIISSDDPDALEKLKVKLKDAENEHQSYLEHNKKARKENTNQLPSYVLQNSRQRINTIKKRIKIIELKSKDQTKIIFEYKGIKIIDNVEANRIQIIFGEKPEIEVRNKLKSSGFRWSGKNLAWQRYRGGWSNQIAIDLVKEL